MSNEALTWEHKAFSVSHCQLMAQSRHLTQGPRVARLQKWEDSHYPTQAGESGQCLEGTWDLIDTQETVAGMTSLEGPSYWPTAYSLAVGAAGQLLF